jgi:hypothetical protein
MKKYFDREQGVRRHIVVSRATAPRYNEWLRR